MSYNELSEDTKAAYDRIFDHPVLTHEQHIVLARRIERGDFDAKNELIRCNLKLAGKRAHCFAKVCQHLTFEDLFTAAVLGLTRAAEKFDYRRGFTFSAYATAWINSEIQKEMNRVEPIIRFGDTESRKVAKLSRARREAERELTLAELAERTGLSEAKILHYDALQDCRSLDAPLHADEPTTLLELVPDPASTCDEPDPTEHAVVTGLQKLSAADREIVVDIAVHGETREQIAARMGIPPLEVARRYRKAVATLRTFQPEAAAA